MKAPKIRIRPSSVVRGSWFACFVVDKERDEAGVCQRPVGAIGSLGDTPKEAYNNLRKRACGLYLI